MAIRKENDWVGVNLANPDFTNTDFKDVGINTNNTSIGPESAYISNPQIRQMQEFQTNGKFDQAKFHEKYVELAASYNDLAKDTYTKDIKGKSRIFAENDIFVSPEERRESSGAFMTLINNPDHITYGIVGVDAPGPRTKTPMELAEMNKIYDSKTGEFTEYTAEESLFKDFWKPKMMATWDYNADANGNPTEDPTKIVHVKGEYKLTEDGEYYTEYVNGRSTYGKELVSHWNILTKEDSWINKYDPFDSDDIQKSTTGSIVRNALKILPLLTPVAPYYAVASIGINLVDALGTLGKLVAGSENPTLNNVTAFAEQFNQTTSEAGVANTFSMENILNMVGDTFMFLESQRIFAEQAPKLFDKEISRILKNPNQEIRTLTGDYIQTGTEAINKKYRELTKITSDLSLLNFNKAEEIKALHGIAATRAAAIVNNRINNYHKLGRQLSTSLMAITFGLHTYGTAKAQGVSDTAATALTLGAIAGQYGLLSSHIGQKIFPEATLERQQINKAIKEWISYGRKDSNYIKDTEKFVKALTAQDREKALKPIFTKGYEMAQSIWNVQESIPGTIIASTAATGIEMVSFSVLDDLIASVYNLASWVSGEKNRMSAWENIGGRYGTALLGGGIAGAITARKTYQNAMKIRNMTRPEAFSLIVHMINEGKEEELLKIIDKGVWGSKDLSTEVIARRELNDGTYEDLYGTGTPENNENEEIKTILKNAIIDLKTVLQTYGTIISKDSLLDVMVNGQNITKDLRLAALKQSNFAQAFLKEYVDNQLVIYDNAMQISLDEEDKIKTGRTDIVDREVKQQLDDLERSKDPQEYQEKEDELSEQAAQQKNAKEELAAAIRKNRQFFDGTKRLELIKKALFEMQYGLNSAYIDRYFVEWATKKANVDDFSKIARSELKDLAKQFYKEAGSELEMEKLDNAFRLFESSLYEITPSLKKLKESTENEQLTDLMKMFESVRINSKNQLFAMFNEREGVINPYEMEEQSPYSFSMAGGRNTPIRPEQFIAMMNFPGYAVNKLGYDSFYLLAELMRRYKDNVEGIRKLFSLADNLTEYRKLIKNLYQQYDVQVQEYFNKLKAWNERQKAWEENPENADKPFEEAAPEGPQKVTKETILAAIQEFNNSEESKKTELPESIEAIRKSQNELVDLFVKLHDFIEKNSPEDPNAEVPEEVTQARAMYDILLSYGERPDPTLTPEEAERQIQKRTDNFNRIEAAILNTVQFGITMTQGKQFVKELTEILGTKGGYLNDFYREQITQLLENLQQALEYEINRSPLTLDNKDSVSGKSTIFHILEAIGFLSNDDPATKQILQMAKELSSVNTFNSSTPEGTELNKFKDDVYELLEIVKNYNSDGIMTVADNLMKTLTGKDKGVSGVLAAIDKEVLAKSDRFRGFGVDRRLKTSEFIFSDEFVNDINQAILVLQMIRSGFASSTEEVDSAFNHVGYAATVEKIKKQHNIKDGPELTTLKLELVNEGIQNIENSIYKLMYWKEVAANAMMLRTKITDRADLGFRLNLMDQVIKKILKTESLEGWNGLANFRTAIDGLSAFNALRGQKREERLTGVSEKDYENVTRELIQFEQALHQFLAVDNKDIINNPVKLAELINEENFALGNTIDPIKNDDNLSDDNGIIWYLATVAAIDPEVFYSNLKESLLEDRLPVALQTQYKLNIAAFYHNSEIFNKFRLALLESRKRKKDPTTGDLIYKDLFSDDVEAKRKAEQEFARKEASFTKNVKLTNTFLISSGPGFGKSTYIPELIILLEHLFPDFKRETNLWLSGPDTPDSTDRTQMAAKMRENIGAKDTPIFNRDTLMKLILKDFDTYENNFKVTNGKLSSSAKLTLNFEDGSINFPFELNDGITNLPKVIIIDEISEFSTFDIKVIDKFAQKHGIKVFAHGDFSQSGIYGRVEVDEGLGTPVLHELGLKDVEFMRGFKSQLTFRSTNTQTDRNNALLRTYIDNLLKYYSDPKNEQVPPELKLTHYRDSAGNLFGTYVQEAEEGIEELSAKTKQYIDGMYATLEEGEKVVLLFGDENSIAYKYISSHSEWADKTEFRKGSVIKSTENKYYIIDLNNVKFDVVSLNPSQISDIQHYIREYYTALTRQKQGTIVIDHITNKIPNMAIKGSNPDTNTTKIELPKKFIQKRSEEFKHLLSTTFPEVKSLGEEKKTPSGEEPPKGGTGERPKPIAEIKEPVNDGDQLDSKNFARFANANHAREQEQLGLRIGRNDGVVKAPGRTTNGVPFDIPDEFIEFILNTFNALRTGLTTDFKYSKHAEERRDCVNGLRYIQSILQGKNLGIRDLDNPTENTAKDVIEFITRIHTMVRTLDNDDIKKELFNLLQLNGTTLNGKPIDLSNFDIRYGIVTYPEKWVTDAGKSLDNNPWIYVDRENERLWGGKGQGTRNNEINRKELVLIVGRNNGTQSDDVLLTVPILTFPNYKTIYNKGKSSLPEVVTTTLDKIFEEVQPGHPQSLAAAEALRGLLVQDPTLKGAAALLKMIEFYCITSNDMFYLDSDTQLVKTQRNKNGLFNHMGWFVSAAERGYDYDETGFEQLSREARRITEENIEKERLTLHDLEELRQEGDKEVSRIFTVRAEDEGYKYVKDAKVEGFTLYAGAYYVLISDKGAFDDFTGQFIESDMFKYFQKQLADPENTPIKVKAIAVRPPEATFKEFIDAEHTSMFAKEGSPDRRQDIGNEFTIYRILQKLVAANEGTNQVSAVSKCILMLRDNNLYDFSNIRNQILQLTYIEGLLAPERREKLGQIYELADRELENRVKIQLEQYCKNFTEGDYVSAISAKLTTTVQDGDLNILLRTAFRRFLQIAYDPRSMTRAEFITWSSYDQNEFQKFIETAASEQALVYNPTHEESPTYKIAMNLDQNTTINMNFHLAKTDTKDSFTYKEKNYQYASTIFSGPFVGNIMQIVDRVFQRGADFYFNPNAKRINVFEKRAKSKFVFQNDVIKEVFETQFAKIEGTVEEMNDKLQPYGMFAIKIGRDTLIMDLTSFPNEAKNIKSKKYSDFGQKEQLVDTIAYDKNDVIITAEVNNNLKFYKIERNSDGKYILIDITKQPIKDPWLDTYEGLSKMFILHESASVETNSRGVTLITFDNPIQFEGHQVKRLIIDPLQNDNRTVYIESENGERSTLSGWTPEIYNIASRLASHSFPEIIHEDTNLIVLRGSGENHRIIIPKNKNITVNGEQRIVRRIIINNKKILVDIDNTTIGDLPALELVKQFYPEAREWYKDVIIEPANADTKYRISQELRTMLQNFARGTLPTDVEEYSIKEIIEIMQNGYSGATDSMCIDMLLGGQDQINMDNAFISDLRKYKELNCVN